MRCFAGLLCSGCCVQHIMPKQCFGCVKLINDLSVSNFSVSVNERCERVDDGAKCL